MIFWLLACSPSAEDIAKAVTSENPVMREDGAKIAQNYDDEVVVDALITVLPDPSEKVRLNAIESLAEIQDQKCGDALIERLKSDPSPKVRLAAADALGRLLYKNAVPTLVSYAGEFAVDDRQQLGAIWAIGRIAYEGLDADVKKQAMSFLVERREKATDPYVLYNISVALRYMK